MNQMVSEMEIRLAKELLSLLKNKEVSELDETERKAGALAEAILLNHDKSVQLGIEEDDE